MVMPVNLDAVPLTDNHCHALYGDQAIPDLETWQSFFTEGGEGIAHEDVRTTAFFRRLVARLADFFGCASEPEAVFAARQSRAGEGLIADLFQPTNTGTLVVDTGIPPRDVVLPEEDFSRITGIKVARILRLEVLFQEIILRHDRLADVEEMVREVLGDLRSQGYVGLKSIAAYRTGLAIHDHPHEAAERAFTEARADADRQGHLRITHKPLLDTLLITAFREAARQELPVQFHTGYGDTDADMLLANPFQLRWVLENPTFRGMKPVLLHESYPYTRQAGYLCAVYDRVYMDLSYAIPFLGVEAMRAFTREAFGVAPSSKLLYASDAIRVPELFWMSAIDGRRVLGQVLAEIVADGDLPSGEAEAVGEAVLQGNAMRLYDLT